MSDKKIVNKNGKLECPCCKSERVYSNDNQSLWHPKGVSFNQEEVTDETSQFDSEIYVNFVCLDCDSQFELILDLKPKEIWNTRASQKYIDTLPKRERTK